MTLHRAWSFRGGSWFGVFGDNAAVVLPPSEKARVPGVWELVDEGAGFDETLDALISSGLRDLPGFVLVATADDETRVVVRGAARVELTTADEVVHVDGDEATTWVERTLHGVTRTRIDVGEDDGSPDLVVAGGLVRVAGAQCPPPSPEAEERGAEPAAEPVVEPIPEPVVEHVVDEPVTETMPSVVAADHDGLTMIGFGEPLAHPQPGIPGQPPVPHVTVRPVARLLFSSGQDVTVDRAVIVGRAPQAPASSPPGEHHLVTVPSAHQEISSTHLEVRPGSGADHGSAVVTDLGSTNGTLLVQPGLPPEDLKAGVAVQLIPGAVIDLGDGVSIQVVNP